MMTKIEKIWQELEGDSSLQSGLLYKRYSGEVVPDVYVALKAPEKMRCIAAHISNAFQFDTKPWDKFRDIKIQRLPDKMSSEKQFLVVLLLSGHHKDVFSTLCEDLILKTAQVNDEKVLVKELITRLEQWYLLFEKIGRQGLSREAQRGLYGELFFLRQFLCKNNNAEYCVNSWHGSAKNTQDFHHSGWAVEIKTTSGKNQQKLYISSERQLDTTLIPNTFIFHLSLEVRVGHGETLNDIVEDLYKTLSDSPAAFSIFNLKLLEAGFFSHHYEEYMETGYSIRQKNIYRVADDFPRITESMIPPGVGDVRYSIVISANEGWALEESQLFYQITN